MRLALPIANALCPPSASSLGALHEDSRVAQVLGLAVMFIALGELLLGSIFILTLKEI